MSKAQLEEYWVFLKHRLDEYFTYELSNFIDYRIHFSWQRYAKAIRDGDEENKGFYGHWYRHYLAKRRSLDMKIHFVDKVFGPGFSRKVLTREVRMDDLVLSDSTMRILSDQNRQEATSPLPRTNTY